MKYKRIPITIDAIKFENNLPEIEAFLSGYSYATSENTIYITNKNETFVVTKGNWICKDSTGFLFTQKNDIFIRSYVEIPKDELIEKCLNCGSIDFLICKQDGNRICSCGLKWKKGPDCVQP